MYFFKFIVCLNTITSMIKTNLFSILLIFRHRLGRPDRSFLDVRDERPVLGGEGGGLESDGGVDQVVPR